MLCSCMLLEVAITVCDHDESALDSEKELLLAYR